MNPNNLPDNQHTRIPKRCRVPILVMLFLLLAACTAPRPGAAPLAAALPGPENPLPETFLRPHDCIIAGHPAFCGSLPVLENPADPNSRVIALNVAVIPALNRPAEEDPIFYLAGGPGSAATEDAGNVGLLCALFCNHRDLVLVDQRGTGGSHQVVRPPLPDFSSTAPGAYEATMAEFIQAALPELEMDPRFYTTSVAMDDLDQVRQELGYDKINLYGISYGATAAQYYLALHEEHVRSATLVVGTRLDIPMLQRWAPNAQHALERTLRRCESDPACSKHYPNIRAELQSVLDRLARQPKPVRAAGGEVLLTRDVFAEKVRAISRDAAGAASLPRLIHRAYEDTDWTAFVEAPIGDWGPQVMSYIIICSERWASNPPEETARQAAGSYLAGWSTVQAQNYAVICKNLPRGATSRDPQQQPHSYVPVLMINGEIDPQAPPANVEGWQALWPNGLAVTLPWQGHSLSDPTAIHCMGSIVQEFVERGSAQGVDTRCTQDMHPAAFDLRE